MKRRYAVIGLALVVGFSTISPALGGPSPVAEVAGGVKKLAKKALGKSKKANKRARKAKRQAKRAKKLAKESLASVEALEGTPGPQGPRGPKGDPATTLFGHVKVNGTDVSLAYGEGVESVEGYKSSFSWLVTFDRNIRSCVPMVTAGINGDDGTYALAPAVAKFVSDTSVEVDYGQGNLSSWFIAMLCP